MRFSDILQKYVWLNIEPTFEQLYPDQIFNVEIYAKIFDELKNTAAIDCSIKIEISYTHEMGKQEEFITLVGKNLHSDLTNKKDKFALEFRPWAEWLGMEFDDLTCQHFTEYEIISHCLYEMTFIGFDQDTIRSEWQAIKDISDEIEDMSEMGKKEQFISWDECKDDISLLAATGAIIGFGEN